jgi:sec-independent protein translocase protein TatC
MAKKPISEMSFLDHLEALRWVFVRCSAAIVIGAFVAAYFADFIFKDIVFAPISTDFITYEFFCELAQKYNLDKSFCNTKMNFDIQNTEMEGQISLYIWTCITSGFIISFPFVLYQFWLFISPALYKKEKKNSVLFIGVSSILFFLGVTFGYFIIAPLTINFTSNFVVWDQIKNEINVNNYLATLKTSTLASGITFELPVIIYFLSKLGLVTPTFLRYYRKWAIVIILIVSAIITPPDVISQILVSLPLLILYAISIYLSALVQKKQKSIS